MVQKSEKAMLTYNFIRESITSDHVAIELWKVIDITKMKLDKAKYLINTVKDLSFDEVKQIELIDAVWHRYYRLVAEQSFS